MTSVGALQIGRAALAGILFATATAALAPSAASARPTLQHFTSEAALDHYLDRLKRRTPPPPPPPPAPPPPGMALGATESVAVTGSITNNQETNVDEGDIVKQHGDGLIILRRGRLFTVSLAHGGMTPVDSIDAYPPGLDATGDWYDEMLIAGDRIVVIGYSYARGGTQINRFHVDAAGHLRFEDAYQLRSNDYYSARNYASRLIGHQLILYSPRYIAYDDPSTALPALRRWTGDPKAGFVRIGSARTVYLPPNLSDDMVQAMHTVTSCDLTAAILDCRATSVFGPDGGTFYVSSNAVYVWLSPWWGDKPPRGRASSLLYRLPLDGSAPSAIGVRGGPVDQFSFREDAADGMLNVLVSAHSAGDAMWASEYANGAVALLRLPLSAFGDGTREAPRSLYRGLPTPRDTYSFHNRFVGDYVLYGVGNGWGTPQDFRSTLIVAPVHGGAPVELKLPHGVDRLEAMGQDAVAIGSDSRNVYFSAVLLGGGTPALGDRYIEKDAAQSETRSHGFFFKPQTADGSSGVLGLPVSLPAAPAYRQLFQTSAAMLYLRRTDGAFSPLGELTAHDAGAVDDKCAASCVDWYGNARPIFLGKRTFALMGYELVEGELSRDGIREIGRVNYAPRNGPRPTR
jgi:hypothetical protein